MKIFQFFNLFAFFLACFDCMNQSITVLECGWCTADDQVGCVDVDSTDCDVPLVTGNVSMHFICVNRFVVGQILLRVHHVRNCSCANRVWTIRRARGAPTNAKTKTKKWMQVSVFERVPVDCGLIGCLLVFGGMSVAANQQCVWHTAAVNSPADRQHGDKRRFCNG